MDLGQVGVIVQARMGSSRLPNKVLAPLNGRPMLQIIIENLKKSQMIQKIIIATSNLSRDDVIVGLGKKLGVFTFQGSEKDVLARYYLAANREALNTIVRITADCPLFDYRLLDSMLSEYQKSTGIDYFSNVIKRTYPRGYDIEIFSSKSLAKAFEKAQEGYQREHVTPYIRENFICKDFLSQDDYSKYRLTVDTPEDFELIKKIFNLNEGKELNLDQVILTMQENSEFININKHIEQKELK